MSLISENLSEVLTALKVAGVIPGRWEDPWKRTAFTVYSFFIDFLFISFIVVKISHTFIYTDLGQGQITVFDTWFDSVMLFYMALERFCFRWKTDDIAKLFEKSGRFRTIGKREEFWQKRSSKRTTTTIRCFKAVAFLALFDVMYSFLSRSCDLQGTKVNCRNFFVDIWLPFSVQDLNWIKPVVYITNLMQVLASVLMVFISFATIPVFVIEVACQFQILAEMFETLPVHGKWAKLLRKDKGRQEVVEAIRYHQFLLDMTQSMKKTFHFFVLTKLIFTSFPIVIVSFCISQIPFGNIQFIRFSARLGMVVFQSYQFCYIGEELAQHSVMIHKAVYYSAWNRMLPCDRKLLLIVSTRALHCPANLEVWSHFRPVNLRIFLDVIHFSYSVYSVLSIVAK